MFVALIVIGVVLYFVLKGRDKPEQLGASKRALGSAPIEPQKFVSPYAKCQACGASGDKMKSDWDGMRTVKWSCGYCGAQAGVQELKDEELPESARRRLGLDPMPGYGAPMQGPQGYQDPMGGAGGLLTGILIGEMMNSGRHHDPGSSSSDWTGSDSGSSSGGSDWGSGGDWGDSGGGDSGGDSGGGDSGGGDW
ncbi:MAG TPA: hypothetical protein VJ600_10370 [Holophagaceae bacterium]|nr:hypothetical protein [Holophagaceae bacterium]